MRLLVEIDMNDGNFGKKTVILDDEKGIEDILRDYVNDGDYDENELDEVVKVYMKGGKLFSNGDWRFISEDGDSVIMVVKVEND